MPEPSLVIVVRHAQSEHHVRRLTGGWTDTPLTSLGHEQSRRLAARLKSELGDTPVALYTSDFQRAMQTAAHIATEFGVEPIADARLREHNNGAAANMTLDDARARYAEAFARPWLMDDRPFPGCESRRELYERASSFLDELDGDGRLPVVVAHGASMECVIARWLRLTPEALELIGFAAHTTGVTTLVRDRFGEPGVERMNDVAHLAGMEGWVGLDGLLAAP
ncbi:MAG: histidine phosphatase family protein [Dehalococcoidia bacterium]